MKHEQSDKARVWTVRRASDGRLYEEYDPWRFARISVGSSLHDLADGLILAAARRKIEETRVW